MKTLSFADAGRMTITELLELRAQATPDRVAVVTPEGSLTYSSWLDQARSIAALLREVTGTAKGDPVLVWTDSADSGAFVTAFHGALETGGIGVPLDDRLSSEEFLRFAQDLEPRAALVSTSLLVNLGLPGWESAGADGSGLVVVPVAGGLLMPKGITAFDAAQTGGFSQTATSFPSPDDCAFLAFTSGSTGRPKGAMISHGGTVQLAERMINAVFAEPRGGRRVTDEDVIQSPIPAYLGTSIANNLYPAALAGAPLHYRGRRFDPVASEQEMVNAGTTIYNGAPAHYAMMCQTPIGDATSKVGVEVMITSGSPLTQSLYDLMHSRWPETAVANWYALNETMVGQTLNHGEELDRDPTSVGRPVWPTELKIIGPLDEAISDGTEGQICLRSPGQMLGYFRNADETAKRIDDSGWIRTGDLGRIDPHDGMLRVTGREGDRINRGAFKFYPAEVEEVLASHPDVLEAAVLGVPHPMFGQDVVAFVVLKQGGIDSIAAPDALRGYTRERLSKHKVPSEILVLEQLPRSGFGKLFRGELRTIWEKENQS